MSYESRGKFIDGQIQGDGANNQPAQPTLLDVGNASKYKGGPNTFIGNFDYTNPSHSCEKIDFSNKKRMSHAYDKHVVDYCFAMTQNHNKKSLEEFIKKPQTFISSAERIDGSYHFETPAYIYQEKGSGNMVVIVNATDNSFITIVNSIRT